MTIRIIIVDDQEVVRAGLKMVLSGYDQIDVVGEARDGQDALNVVKHAPADVILMDVRMPHMNGVEATQRICDAGGPRVLILTTFDLDEYAYDALQAGASGFILKETPTPGLVDAIEHVHDGDAVVAPSTTRRLLTHFTRRPDLPVRQNFALTEHLRDLTTRELDVLRAVASGFSNAEIADRLLISENTVKTHVRRILTKLNLRDRVQAVIVAYENGLVHAE